VAAERLEQLGHPGVVDPAAGERVADVVGEVVVAERDGVGVAVGALRISAAVQSPIPGTARSAFSTASPVPSATVRSSAAATWAAAMTVRDRLPSTPARCQAHDGMSSQAFGGGQTRR
jgi:hypothetical protein